MSNTEASIIPFWSNKTECLADEMISELFVSQSGDPFAKPLIITQNKVMANWIKQRYLLKTNDKTRIIASTDFQLLYPFVNDLLYAAIEKDNPENRRPSSHPYSKEVLVWRIYNIINQNPSNNDYKEILAYIGNDEKTRHTRLFELSGQLARTFDNYQTSRFEMISKFWRKGLCQTKENCEKWQKELWNELWKETDYKGTYIDDFAELDNDEISLSEAFNHGIPKYSSVNVFGITSLPKPYLTFFKKLAKVVPVRFFLFNPSREYWIDDPTLSHAKNLYRNDIAKNLDKSIEDTDEAISLLTHPLLGLYGTGVQGLLGDILDDETLDIQDLFYRPSAPPATLLRRVQEHISSRSPEKELQNAVSAKDDSIEVHLAHTPQRELQIIKDNLLTWFSENPDATPDDVAVLCADYKRYGPFVSHVFDSNPSDCPAIPYSLQARITTGSGVIIDSFINLLKITSRPQTYLDLLSFLAVPNIANRYSISQSEYEIIKELVENNYIRWGFDDGDVARIVGAEKRTKRNLFTIQAGLDRILLGALVGNETDLIDGGALGDILVSNGPEGERAAAIGKLSAFVHDLKSLSSALTERRTPKEWNNFLLETKETFFASTDDDAETLTYLSKTIATITSRIESAESLTTNQYTYDIDIIAISLENELSSSESLPMGRGSASAITFAPLQAGITCPKRFIWVCGLNSSSFPRQDIRPAFDLTRQKPTLWDKSLRRDDNLAFLEAIMGAREKLSLSYLGLSEQTNKEMPPSVSLSAFLDFLGRYFTREGEHEVVKRTFHKLQAFNKSYFIPKSDIKSWSNNNYFAARTFLQRQNGISPNETTEYKRAAFNPEMGENNIALKDLINFFQNPPRFIQRKYASIYLNKNGKDLPNTDETLELSIPTYDKELFLTDTISEKETEIRTQQGQLADSIIGKSALVNLILTRENANFRKRPIGNIGKRDHNEALDIPNTTISEAILSQNSNPEEIEGTVSITTSSGQKISLSGKVAGIILTTAKNEKLFYSFTLSQSSNATAKDKVTSLLNHLFATILSPCKVASVVAAIKDTSFERLNPLTKEEAEEALCAILTLATTKYPSFIPFLPSVSWELKGNNTEGAKKALNEFLNGGYNKSADPNGWIYYGKSLLDSHTLNAAKECAETFFKFYNHTKIGKLK